MGVKNHGLFRHHTQMERLECRKAGHPEVLAIRPVRDVTVC